MSAFNEFKNLMAEATAAQKKKIQDGVIVESEQIPEKSALDEFKNLIKEAAIIPKKRTNTNRRRSVHSFSGR